MVKVEQGEDDSTPAQLGTREMSVVKEEVPTPGKTVPLEPPPSEFIMDTPPILAAEL